MAGQRGSASRAGQPGGGRPAPGVQRPRPERLHGGVATRTPLPSLGLCFLLHPKKVWGLRWVRRLSEASILVSVSPSASVFRAMSLGPVNLPGKKSFMVPLHRGRNRGWGRLGLNVPNLVRSRKRTWKGIWQRCLRPERRHDATDSASACRLRGPWLEAAPWVSVSQFHRLDMVKQRVALWWPGKGCTGRATARSRTSPRWGPLAQSDP